MRRFDDLLCDEATVKSMIRLRHHHIGDEPVPTMHADRLTGLNLSVQGNPHVLGAKTPSTSSIMS